MDTTILAKLHQLIEQQATEIKEMRIRDQERDELSKQQHATNDTKMQEMVAYIQLLTTTPPTPKSPPHKRPNTNGTPDRKSGMAKPHDNFYSALSDSPSGNSTPMSTPPRHNNARMNRNVANQRHSPGDIRNIQNSILNNNSPSRSIGSGRGGRR